jgi:hypothetical protein
MKNIKLFEEYLNEKKNNLSKLQPSAGKKAGKIIDAIDSNGDEYIYYSDFEGLEHPIPSIESAIKKLGISNWQEAIVVFSDSVNDLSVVVDMAKKVKLKFAEVPDDKGNEYAIVFSEVQ